MQDPREGAEALDSPCDPGLLYAGLGRCSGQDKAPNGKTTVQGFAPLLPYGSSGSEPRPSMCSDGCCALIYRTRVAAAQVPAQAFVQVGVQVPARGPPRALTSALQAFSDNQGGGDGGRAVSGNGPARGARARGARAGASAGAFTRQRDGRSTAVGWSTPTGVPEFCRSARRRMLGCRKDRGSGGRPALGRVGDA